MKNRSSYMVPSGFGVSSMSVCRGMESVGMSSWGTFIR